VIWQIRLSRTRIGICGLLRSFVAEVASGEIADGRRQKLLFRSKNRSQRGKRPLIGKDTCKTCSELLPCSFLSSSSLYDENPIFYSLTYWAQKEGQLKRQLGSTWRKNEESEQESRGRILKNLPLSRARSR
jgi:hypothetical protein